MKEQQERLKHFDDHKLIDIAKNYRQYGYEEALREAALAILEERGITQEQLKLTGNFDNLTYEQAQELYAAFNRNSAIAVVLYGLLVVFKMGTYMSGFEIRDGVLVLILFLVVLIAYFIYFVQSFYNQRQFFKIIGKEEEAESGVLYFIVGMPLFILLYFYFKKRMKEHMRLIS